jgi:hypothetical protein
MSMHRFPDHPRAALPVRAGPPYTLTLTADPLDPHTATAPLTAALLAAGHAVEQRRFLDAPAAPVHHGTLLITLAGTLDQLVGVLQESATQTALVRTVFPAGGVPWGLLQLKATAVFVCLPLASPAELQDALSALLALVSTLPLPRGGERATGGGEWVLQWAPGGWVVTGPPTPR